MWAVITVRSSSLDLKLKVKGFDCVLVLFEPRLEFEKSLEFHLHASVEHFTSE